MKRFAFPQQQLLRLKQREQRLLEARVARARAELDRAELQLRQALQRLDRFVDDLAQGGGGDFLRARAATPALERRIDEARRQAAAARAELDRQRRQLREVNVKVKSLDSLREQRRLEYRKECLAREQEEVDYSVMLRWSKHEKETHRA